MKTDDLVTEDVVASRQRARDLDGPGVTGLHEVVRGPSARRAGTADETALGDLEEAEGSSGRGGEAVDLGQVVDDRTVVRLRPGVPGQLDAVAGLDGNGGGAGLCALVASDVRGAVAVGRDEAVVLVQGVPAGGGGLLVGGKVVPILGMMLAGALLVALSILLTYRVGTRVGLATGRDLRHVAVGRDGRGKSHSRKGGDLRQRRVVHSCFVAIG